jgi:L,D-peptidoglycan transpeptidase YkuD (ErfK/YbiS/YcfS/YnhG family)
MLSLKKYFVSSIALVSVTCVTCAYAQTLAIPRILSHSQQLLLVISKNWPASTATLQRYQRNFTYQAWSPVGQPIPVVIGKAGMGWGIPFASNQTNEVKKAEGDLRTPIGIFALGPAFGYAKQPTPGMQLNYLNLSEDTYCVDDTHSKYYNQIVSRSSTITPDWHSAEAMRQVPGYRLGLSVLYNQKPSHLGAGSCIFMHIWRGPTIATTGCVAMTEPNLAMLQTWLDRSKQPVLATFPEPVYQKLRKSWQLPL